jgi:hypothetical protein
MANNKLGKKIGEQVKQHVWFCICIKAIDQVGDQKMESLWNQPWRSVDDLVKGQVGDQVRRRISGR